MAGARCRIHSTMASSRKARIHATKNMAMMEKNGRMTSANSNRVAKAAANGRVSSSQRTACRSRLVSRISRSP